MKPLFSKVLMETAYTKVTIQLVRGLAGWYVYVIDNGYKLALWGCKCNKATAFERYNTLITRYSDWADA